MSLSLSLLFRDCQPRVMARFDFATVPQTTTGGAAAAELLPDTPAFVEAMLLAYEMPPSPRKSRLYAAWLPSPGGPLSAAPSAAGPSAAGPEAQPLLLPLEGELGEFVFAAADALDLSAARPPLPPLPAPAIPLLAPPPDRVATRRAAAAQLAAAAPPPPEEAPPAKRRVARGPRRRAELAEMSEPELQHEFDLRLEKNRISARECRKRKKARMLALYLRIDALERENTALIAHVRSLGGQWP